MIKKLADITVILLAVCGGVLIAYYVYDKIWQYPIYFVIPAGIATFILIILILSVLEWLFMRVNY